MLFDTAFFLSFLFYQIHTGVLEYYTNILLNKRPILSFRELVGEFGYAVQKKRIYQIKFKCYTEGFLTSFHEHNNEHIPLSLASKVARFASPPRPHLGFGFEHVENNHENPIFLRLEKRLKTEDWRGSNAS
ncbi:hypothetical protein KUCAC02_003607 [Chaenocephalus aceratus]|uniref:Uncharacterized protein n=1 Tax=Chaenocephalus aceratus TaxID=36190 RepID=A0ACB9WM01_CHAAC|nr:hypothetical protein KUCAC02_003607 [Chaenocephalus aceratus]